MSLKNLVTNELRDFKESFIGSSKFWGREIKGLVGDMLGYGRCPITKCTYWREETASVPYTDNQGMLISTKALQEATPRNIALLVWDRVKDEPTFRKKYGPDKIEMIINEGLQTFPA